MDMNWYCWQSCGWNKEIKLRSLAELGCDEPNIGAWSITSVYHEFQCSLLHIKAYDWNEKDYPSLCACQGCGLAHTQAVAGWFILEYPILPCKFEHFINGGLKSMA